MSNEYATDGRMIGKRLRMTWKKIEPETTPPHRSQKNAERRQLLGATLRSFRQKANM